MFLKKSWKKGIIIFFISFMLMFIGMIKVNIEFTKNIKEHSGIKIFLNRKPFDFHIDFKEYVFYINENVVEDTRDYIVKVFDDIR